MNPANRPFLAPATAWAVSSVAARMREWDRREIFATRVDDDPDRLALAILATPGPAWVAWIGDDPVAAIGLAPMWPGVMSPWCFGTDRFRQVHLLLTRLARTVIIPNARAAGAHRLEVKTMDGHEDAQRWMLKTFRAKHEGTHPKFGQSGETFHTFALIL